MHIIKPEKHEVGHIPEEIQIAAPVTLTNNAPKRANEDPYDPQKVIRAGKFAPTPVKQEIEIDSHVAEAEKESIN
jgi:hypothetical protein